MGVVAGGFLPAELRGTKNFATIHVADWCECSNGLPHHYLVTRSSEAGRCC